MSKKTKDLRILDISELKIKLNEARDNYTKELMKSKTGARTDKAISLKNLRKNVARLLTIITEKELVVLKPASVEKKQVKNTKEIPKAEKETQFIVKKKQDSKEEIKKTQLKNQIKK